MRKLQLRFWTWATESTVRFLTSVLISWGILNFLYRRSNDHG